MKLISHFKLLIKNDLKNFTYVSFLFLLIPPFLITGPFIPDLLLIIICIYYCAKHSKKIIKILLNNKIIFFLILFSSYNAVNSLFAKEILISIKSSFSYFRFPIFAVAISLIILQNNKLNNYFLLILKYVIIFLSVDSIFQFIFNFNFFGFVSIQGNRISGMFGDEYVLGSYLSKIFPIYLFLEFYIKNRLEKKIEILFITAIVYLAVFISGERTSFIILNIYLIITFFIISDLKYKKFLKHFFVLGILSLFILLSFSKDLKERYISLTAGQIFNIDIGNYGSDALKNQNFKHLLVSFEMFKDKPITGYGNKMFRYNCFDNYFIDDGRCSTHPHNFLAQIAVESGIIGLLIFGFFYFYLLKEIILLRNKNNYLFLLIIIAVNFFPFFPSGNLFNNWLNILFYIPIGFYLFLKENDNISNKHNT